MPASDIIVKGAREHNLRDVDLVLPRNKLICLTGVSGSGKSSLVSDILVEALRRDLNRGEGEPGAHRVIEGLEHLDKMIAIDQSPIGQATQLPGQRAVGGVHGVNPGLEPRQRITKRIPPGLVDHPPLVHVLAGEKGAGRIPEFQNENPVGRQQKVVHVYLAVYSVRNHQIG